MPRWRPRALICRRVAHCPVAAAAALPPRHAWDFGRKYSVPGPACPFRGPWSNQKLLGCDQQVEDVLLPCQPGPMSLLRTLNDSSEGMGSRRGFQSGPGREQGHPISTSTIQAIPSAQLPTPQRGIAGTQPGLRSTQWEARPFACHRGQWRGPVPGERESSDGDSQVLGTRILWLKIGRDSSTKSSKLQSSALNCSMP
ncbi:hypothetical protein B0I37DRAFT_371686 [Chaetomium sp. MPI-CAGE-AT-0009]|nr:hypothetical protein B0I37DRAFT_371686 [Chaetomium sp. MPI-CAGE-AT-0009]